MAAHYESPSGSRRTWACVWEVLSASLVVAEVLGDVSCELYLRLSEESTDKLKRDALQLMNVIHTQILHDLTFSSTLDTVCTTCLKNNISTFCLHRVPMDFIRFLE